MCVCVVGARVYKWGVCTCVWSVCARVCICGVCAHVCMCGVCTCVYVGGVCETRCRPTREHRQSWREAPGAQLTHGHTQRDLAPHTALPSSHPTHLPWFPLPPPASLSLSPTPGGWAGTGKDRPPWSAAAPTWVKAEPLCAWGGGPGPAGAATAERARVEPPAPRGLQTLYFPELQCRNSPPSEKLNKP